MTDEQILELAKQNGMHGMLTDVLTTTGELIAFARSIEQATLERCAVVVEEGALKDYERAAAIRSMMK